MIINTASISGVRCRPGLSAYSASKGAAIILTRSLAIELASFKIRVNCINPVAAETPMLVNLSTTGARSTKNMRRGGSGFYQHRSSGKTS